ncbi:MAG: flagellar basal body-associated FliL family protein [Candidatus Latescibacterota bacterium]|jgi:flagellar basal body-associated protein FliL
MADEDMMEMDELGEDEGDAGGGGGGNPILKYLPLIGIVLVVQVVIIYFAVQWFMPDDMPDDSMDAAATEQVEVVEASEESPKGEGGFVPPKTTVLTIFDKLETIVVNPAGTDGLRFLSTQVFLGLSDLKVEEYITTNHLVPRINDTLVAVFSSKTISDLDPSRHTKLKEEIRKRLNQFLGENAVLEVYFQSFVLQ